MRLLQDAQTRQGEQTNRFRMDVTTISVSNKFASSIRGESSAPKISSLATTSSFYAMVILPMSIRSFLYPVRVVGSLKQPGFRVSIRVSVDAMNVLPT